MKDIQNQTGKQYLDKVIERFIKLKLSFEATKQFIEDLTTHQLSEYDHKYIEDKYLDTLVKKWLIEEPPLIRHRINPIEVLDVLKQLESLNTFEDCRLLLCNSKTTELLADLNKASDKLKSQEKQHVNKFRYECLLQADLESDILKEDFQFIKCFIDLLKSSDNLTLLWKDFGIETLSNKENESVKWKQLFDNIQKSSLSGSKVLRLKTAARSVLKKDDFLFTKQLWEIISNYLKPVNISDISIIDGRHVLEISGKRLVFSEIVERLEILPGFSEVEEVRFVKAETIHANHNLYKSVWHGKNIVVYCETLIVSSNKEVIWDVSGKDAVEISTECAGTRSDGTGLAGNNGKDGESGGNVVVMATSIHNALNLSIVSKGGKGGKGQDGGKGMDGKDGDFIDKKEFTKKFPPVSKFFSRERLDNLKKTMESAYENLLSVEEFFWGIQNFGHISQYKFFEIMHDKSFKNLENLYFELKTKNGCRITFSFYSGSYLKLSPCQSFLLYKGAEAQAGLPGGSPGYGGKGGFAGEIDITLNVPNCITEDRENGEDGASGNPGSSGMPGKNGADRAYTDCSNPLGKWPNIVAPLPKDNKRLKIHYSNNGKGIYCPYNTLYAEIIEVKEHVRKHQTCPYQSTQKTHKKQESNTRKKTINKDSIKERYKENSSIDLFKLEDCIVKAKENLEKIISEEVLQTENVISECKVMKKVTYQNNLFTQYPCELILANSIMYHDDVKCADKIPVPLLIELVKGEKENIQLWSNLMKESLNVNEMHELVQELPANKELKIDFWQKYHLMLLEHVETNLNQSTSCYRNVSHRDLKLNSIAPGKIFNNLLSANHQHQPYNDVEEYFFEDSEHKRKEFVEKCKDHYEEEAFRECMVTFIDEFAQAEGHGSPINKIKKRYNLFDKEKNENLQIKLLPVKNILSKAENQDLNKYLIGSLLEQSIESKIKFEKSIKNQVFFKFLYSNFVKNVHRHYDWTNPFGRKDAVRNQNTTKQNLLSINTLFFTKFETKIKEKGPNASFYRVFLAYLFRTNILLYSVNEQGQIVLVDSYNSKAKDSVHILWKEDKFLRLSVNNGFAEMISVQKNKGELYSKLRYHISSIIESNELDDFVSTRPFLLNGYTGVDKITRMQVRVGYLQRQDEDVRVIADSFNSEPDKSLIRDRLEKLKFDVSGYEDVLYFMALHFHCEVNHISAKELCFVINCVLKAATEGIHKMSLVSWAIAAYRQTLWLVELTLLELEAFLKTSLTHEQRVKWRLDLQKIKEKETLMLFLEKISCDRSSSVSVQCVEETLCLISKIPIAYIGLERIDLGEWKYYLKDRFWIYEIRFTIDWSEDELKTASYLLVVMENLLGIDKCHKFVNIVKNHSATINCKSARKVVLDTMRMMTRQEMQVSDSLLVSLSYCTITDWKGMVEKEFHATGKPRNLTQLRELIRNSSNTSEGILTKLDNISSCVNDLNGSVLKLENHCNNDLKKLKEWILKLLQFVNQKACKPKPKNVTVTVRKLTADSLLDAKEILLATVVTAINMLFKIKLRETQTLAIMTMLKHDRNVMSQVSTGEGKSLIVVALAIMKAISGKKVDIITSSKVLAERDAEKSKHIYNLFNINVGHNCSEHIEERKKAYSNNQVVYGELVNFQRDHLLDHFYGDNILGDRAFETVIVDEVDSMLLDKGNNILYLSHDIPGMDKLEPLFLFIWMKLNIPSNSDKTDPVIDIADLKGKIMYEMYGMITKEHIKELDKNIPEQILNTTWDSLIDKKIINSAGHVMKQSIDDCTNLLDALDKESCVDKAHLLYLLKKVIGRSKSFEIPNYLMKFVDLHLDEWICSAIRATSMESGIDYVVDVDRSGTSSDRSPNITILDRDTGTDQVNSQWDAGLHQFLQLKHGCRLSLISLKAVFVSNVTYFKFYNNSTKNSSTNSSTNSSIYGLTGTLGSKRERELLQEIYDVDFVMIPTSKPKHFNESIPILCPDVETWLQTIFEEVYKVSKNRSVLVICETVNDVLTVKERFLKNEFSQDRIYTYKRDYEDFDIASNLKPGCIIISTNLAGRGTDIKLSKELIDAGGLHVCLTFLPSNIRVEEQAYGRAARNGEPGSAQLIFRSTSQSAASKIVDLKKQRDVNELLRIADIKKYHKTQIEKEENLFDQFKYEYDKLKTSKHHKELKSILLQDCLDEWSFWLDRNSKNIGSASITFLINSIAELCKGDLDKCNKEVKNPFHLIKLGLLLTTHKKYKSSKCLFDRVIGEEPSLSEIGCYYRVYAESQSKDSKPTELLDNLERVANKLKARIQSCLTSAHIIDRLKKQNLSSILQIESFKEQQFNICRTYETFLHSIYDIIGSKIEPYSFHNPPDIDEQTADNLYHDLSKEGILTKEKVNPSISESDLTFSMEYGMPPKIIYDLLKNQEPSEFDSNKFLKSLKNEFLFPSLNIFWKELIYNRILTKEESFMFIDKDKLRMFDPCLHEELVRYNEPLKNTGKKLWLWNPKERFGETEMMVIKKPIIDSKFEYKYQLFKQKGIMFSNKQASLTIQRLADVEFCHFDALSLDHFRNIGIAQHVAEPIIEELKKNCVLRESSTQEDQPEYKLLINANDICNVELSTHKAYSDDVKSLLRYCFAFRIALQYIQAHQDEAEGFSIPLKMKLSRSFLNALRVREIIQKSIIDYNTNNIEERLKTMYSRSMTKEGYKYIFSKLYDDATCSDIIERMIDNGWLVKDDNLVKKVMRTTKKALSTVMEMEETEMVFSVDKEKLLSNLPATLANISTIQVLTNHLKLVEATSNQNLQTLLENCKGNIHTVETPTFSLLSLKTALEKNNCPTSECGLFTLNGFDQVLKVGEKKYTFKMKIMVFSIAMLGITEIATGAFLQLATLNPVTGAVFHSEGVADLIFAVSCLYTGYCTWRDFIINKVISVALSVTTTLSSMKTVFSSNFGEQCSGLWQSVKQKCSTVFKKTSDVLKKLFGKSTPVNKAVVAKTLIKRVVTSTVQGFSLGLAYSASDHVIQAQSHRLSEAITDVICANIDDTVDAHEVTESLNKFIKDLHLKVGHQMAARIINNCFTSVIQKNKDLTKVSWNQTFGKFKVLIIPAIAMFQSPGKPSGKLDFQMAFKIASIVTDIIKAVNNGHKYYTQINTLVNDILDNLNSEIQENVNKIKATSCISEDNLELDTDVCNGIIDGWKDGIKTLLLEHINEEVICPLLQIVSNELLSYANSMMSRRFNNHFLTVKEEKEFTKFRKQYNLYDVNKSEILGNSKFADLQFQNHLQILKKQRSACVFVEMFKRKAPMNTDCIKLSCLVILQALKREGIKVPGLRVILVKDGIREEFSTAEESMEVPTVTFNQDQDFFTNVCLNAPLVKNFIDTAYNSIIQSNPQWSGFTAQILHGLVILCIDKGLTNIQNHVDDKVYLPNELNIVENTCINQDIEKKFPYQHLNAEGKWSFCPVVDVDLRKEKPLAYTTEVKDHVIQGFKVALDKINNHIFNFKSVLKPQLKLTLDDFEDTAHEIFPQTNRNSTDLLDCITTEYKIILPLIVTCGEQKESVNFNVTMCLRNEAKLQPNRPNGPHVVYNFIPNTPTKHIDKSIKGHVLLSIKCLALCSSYTAQDCHVAGELILPTVNPRDSYQILIIGDSMFKYMSEYICNSVTKTKSFPDVKPSELKPKLSDFITVYPNIKCVVIYFGMFALNMPVYAFDAVMEISEVVTLIRSLCNSEVKIILCTLALRKGNYVFSKFKRGTTQQNNQKEVQAHNKRICAIIEQLRSFAAKEQLALFEMNTYIQPYDLGKDGIHFNKAGYKVVGKHISQKALECINTIQAPKYR